jgi:hypothetical protein
MGDAQPHSAKAQAAMSLRRMISLPKSSLWEEVWVREGRNSIPR